MTALIVPVWLQNQAMHDLFVAAAASWRDQEPLVVYCPTNRLHHVGPADLEASLRLASGQDVRVLHEPGVERSVGGAWNHGIRTAAAAGIKDFVITAMDVIWQPGAIDRLVETGRPREDAITSGVDERSASGDGITEGADFAGLYLSDLTLARFGDFDDGYRPAYFEDNDYVAQVWQRGGEIGQTHRARYLHQASATVRLDAEAAHHVRHWFETNRRRFVSRWGSEPVATKAEAMTRYHFRTHQD